MKKREHGKEECLPKHTLVLTVCNTCLPHAHEDSRDPLNRVTSYLVAAGN